VVKGRGQTGLLVAMGLGSVSLRPQLVGIGPLLPNIQHSLGVTHAIAGLLVTIPVLCMGLFAPTAAVLASRVGTNRAVGGALVLVAVAGIARAITPGAALVLLVTLPVGIGMALGNALMPLAVKGGVPGRPLLGTGVYTTGIQVGSFVAAIVAVPVADIWFGWRGALGAFGIAAAAGAIAWLAFAPRGQGSVVDVNAIPRLPVRNLTAWLLVAMFLCVATNYYGLSAWLPDAYQERGWSEGHAALLIGIFNLATLPAGLFVTFWGDRLGSRRAYMLLAAVALTAGTVLLIEAPSGAYAWAFVGGFGNGMMFPLMMTMPLDVARRPADVSAVTGMMLGFGYTLAAIAPFGLGAVRDSTGSFRTSLWLLAGITTVLAVVVSQLGPARLSHGVAVEPRVRPVAGEL
jgi:CP family cyanate transporter-like MFS transporter